MIYFVQQEGDIGRIKIGFSNNPKKRLDTMQLYCPVRLKIIKIINSDTDTEKLIHRRFKHLRAYGEWFEPAPELMSFIQECNDMFGVGHNAGTLKEYKYRQCKARKANGSRCSGSFTYGSNDFCVVHRWMSDDPSHSRCAAITNAGSRCTFTARLNGLCTKHHNHIQKLKAMSNGQ